MSHLSLEDLARLVDQPPARDEAAHLEECAACREEWLLLQRQTSELAALPPISPPPGEWEAVEARLRAEGLIRAAPRSSWRGGVLKAAAAVMLFLLGAGAGYGVRSALPSEVRSDASPAQPADAALASAPASIDDAAAAVLTAEADYLDALASYNRLAVTQGQSADDMVARLATLQSIVLTTRAALSEAPGDPVINGYHFTALAQRDAVLQQIASAGGEPWF